jgi:hypothetical protein
MPRPKPLTQLSRVVRRIDDTLVKRIAQELLISFKELPGFNTAQIGEIQPIYSLDGTSIAYHEVKFKTPGGKDNGYAIVSATEDDLPVVEFSETGDTHYEKFKKQLAGVTFKMVRFGNTYMTAEDDKGKLLAEIGDRPSVLRPELQVHIRGEGSDHQPPTRPRIKGRVDVSQIRRTSGKISYKDLKSTIKLRKFPNTLLKKHWAVAKSPHSPCTYNYFWADGYNSHPYFTQIPKNTAPNNNDHASGCGPTSWMNIFGWHDLNWCNTILNGSQTTNNDYIRNLTMKLHDRLGTYEPWWTFDSDQGFTWPEDMEKGYAFSKDTLQHSCSYWFRHDWWNTDEQWVFEVARDALRKKRPVIVGYYEDWHYAIAYGIAECSKHGWKEHSWLRIYPAWSANDSQNKWIPMGTIFGIYAAYDYWTLSQGAVGQEVTRYDWTDGWTTVEFYQTGGNTYLFLLKQSNGIVHIHKMNANGTVGAKVDQRDWSNGWTQAKPFKVGANLFLFLLKKSDGVVHIHKINSDGKVGAEVQHYDWSSGWTTVEFFQAGGNTYLFLLKQSGGIVHIHKMNADGTVGTKVDDHDWSDGWTQAQPFNVGTNPFLFLLKKGDGIVHIHKLNNDGKVGQQVCQYDWTSGWTSVEFYQIGGNTYLFLLKEGNGIVHIHKMKADGSVGAQVDGRDWSDGWTQAQPFKVGASPFLFLLKYSTGDVHIHKMIE